jgi:hypothetical protein
MLLAHVDDNNDDYYYYCLVKIPLTPEIARERIIGLIKDIKSLIIFTKNYLLMQPTWTL